MSTWRTAMTPSATGRRSMRHNLTPGRPARARRRVRAWPPSIPARGGLVTPTAPPRPPPSLLSRGQGHQSEQSGPGAASTTWVGHTKKRALPPARAPEKTQGEQKQIITSPITCRACGEKKKGRRPGKLSFDPNRWTCRICRLHEEDVEVHVVIVCSISTGQENVFTMRTLYPCSHNVFQHAHPDPHARGFCATTFFKVRCTFVVVHSMIPFAISSVNVSQAVFATNHDCTAPLAHAHESDTLHNGQSF